MSHYSPPAKQEIVKGSDWLEEKTRHLTAKEPAAKRRVNIGFSFDGWTTTQRHMNANVALWLLDVEIENCLPTPSLQQH